LDYLLSEAFQRQCQRHLFGTRPAAGEAAPASIFSWYGRVGRYLRANRLFHRVVTRPSLLPAKVLDDVIAALVPDADIADAPVPLSIVAVDLLSGRRAVLERGPVRKAVRASKSLPAIFPPVEWDGMLLSDIGVFDSLPTAAARSYTSGPVIAVDVASVAGTRARCDNALEVLLRMDEISECLYRHHSRQAADLIITPAVAETEWFDFSRPLQLVEAGRAAARAALAEASLRHPAFLAGQRDARGMAPAPADCDHRASAVLKT
jgi:NTE family protein